VLQREYTALLKGEEPSSAVLPRRLAAAQRLGVAARRRTADHWADVWPRMVPADRAGTDRSPRTQASFYTERGLRAANVIADQLGISVQSVVLGVTCLGLMTARGVSRMTMGLMASNRVDERWESLVSSMNQLAPLTVELNPAADPHDWLRSLYEEGLVTYSNASFHIDELISHLRGLGCDNPDPMAFDLFFNFVGETGISLADDPASVRLDRVLAPRQTGPTFNLVVETGAGLWLLMRTSRDWLAPVASDALLLGIEAALVDLESGRPDTLATVSFRPIRDVAHA